MELSLEIYPGGVFCFLFLLASFFLEALLLVGNII